MIYRLLLCSLLLAACATGQDSSPAAAPVEGAAEDEAGGLHGVLKFSHSAEEAGRFVRRYSSLSVGFVNYIDPSRTELRSRAISGETVIFRLDSSGDTGLLHEAAADRAVELVTTYAWPEAEARWEAVTESRLALVQVEAIGIPAGARPGDVIPVRITALGNATDIAGGYVYNTPLKNRAGKTVAMLRQGYLPISAAKAETEEQKREAKLLERRDVPGRSTWLLRDSVSLVAVIGDDELSADQIVMPLMREVEPGSGKYKRTLSADLVEQVIPQIEKQMAELGLPCRAEGEGDYLIVTPLGVRDQTLRQVFERVQTLRVAIEPRNHVIAVFDDAVVRVAFYGPMAQRLLIRDVALTVDPFTKNQPNVTPQPSPFRVSCRVVRRAEPGRSRKFGVPDAENPSPDGNLGLVRLTWSRWNEKGQVVDQGTDELPTTDITDILRHLWTRGMKPPEVMGFVLEAKDALAISVELGFNWRKVDVDKLRAEMERDRAAGN